MRWGITLGALGLLVCAAALPAAAQNVYLNPSDQTGNAVAGGGNEAQYALINANLTEPLLTAAGFAVVVDQDFYNAPYNANSWGADIFVSIHSNAGGGHGIETLYTSSGGQVLAQAIQDALLDNVPYQSRGIKERNDLHVLNETSMYAALAEVVFHDCATTSGYQGHPPSESSYLKSTAGQADIAAGLSEGVCDYFSVTCVGGVPPETGWFKGVVYVDPDLDERIPGAVVTLDTGASVVADELGAWAFELDPGTYTATATAPGHEPNSSTRTVTAGEDIWGSIGLTPAVVPPEPDPEAEPIPEPGPPDLAPEPVLDSAPDIVEPIPDAPAEVSPPDEPAADPVAGPTHSCAESGCPPTTHLSIHEADEGCSASGETPGWALAGLLGALALTRRRRVA